MDINNLSIQKNENLFKEQLGDFSKEGILNGYLFVKENGSLAQTNILKYLVEKFKALWGYQDSTNPDLLKEKILQFVNSGKQWIKTQNDVEMVKALAKRTGLTLSNQAIPSEFQKLINEIFNPKPNLPLEQKSKENHGGADETEGDDQAASTSQEDSGHPQKDQSSANSPDIKTTPKAIPTTEPIPAVLNTVDVSSFTIPESKIKTNFNTPSKGPLFPSAKKRLPVDKPESTAWSPLSKAAVVAGALITGLTATYLARQVFGNGVTPDLPSGQHNSKVNGETTCLDNNGSSSQQSTFLPFSSKTEWLAPPSELYLNKQSSNSIISKYSSKISEIQNFPYQLKYQNLLFKQGGPAILSDLEQVVEKGNDELTPDAIVKTKTEAEVTVVETPVEPAPDVSLPQPDRWNGKATNLSSSSLSPLKLISPFCSSKEITGFNPLIEANLNSHKQAPNIFKFDSGICEIQESIAGNISHLADFPVVFKPINKSEYTIVAEVTEEPAILSNHEQDAEKRNDKQAPQILTETKPEVTVESASVIENRPFIPNSLIVFEPKIKPKTPNAEVVNEAASEASIKTNKEVAAHNHFNAAQPTATLAGTFKNQTPIHKNSFYKNFSYQQLNHFDTTDQNINNESSNNFESNTPTSTKTTDQSILGTTRREDGGHEQASSLYHLVMSALGGIMGIGAFAAAAYALRRNKTQESNNKNENIPIAKDKNEELIQKQEQERIEKEQAELEEKLRVEAELKEKTEREDKLKIEKEQAELEEKLKIEEDKKQLQIETEKKEQAELEEKLRVEAELKEKTEREDKLKIEKEQAELEEKLKIEEEKKQLQIETEKKEQAEREEKLRVEAELKEKTEREDKLKIEKENAEREEKLRLKKEKAERDKQLKIEKQLQIEAEKKEKLRLEKEKVELEEQLRIKPEFKDKALREKEKIEKEQFPLEMLKFKTEVKNKATEVKDRALFAKAKANKEKLLLGLFRAQAEFKEKALLAKLEMEKEKALLEKLKIEREQLKIQEAQKQLEIEADKQRLKKELRIRLAELVQPIADEKKHIEGLEQLPIKQSIEIEAKPETNSSSHFEIQVKKITHPHSPTHELSYNPQIESIFSTSPLTNSKISINSSPKNSNESIELSTAMNSYDSNHLNDLNDSWIEILKVDDDQDYRMDIQEFENIDCFDQNENPLSSLDQKGLTRLAALGPNQIINVDANGIPTEPFTMTFGFGLMNFMNAYPNADNYSKIKLLMQRALVEYKNSGNSALAKMIYHALSGLKILKKYYDNQNSATVEVVNKIIKYTSIGLVKAKQYNDSNNKKINSSTQINRRHELTSLEASCIDPNMMTKAPKGPLEGIQYYIDRIEDFQFFETTLQPEDKQFLQEIIKGLKEADRMHKFKLDANIILNRTNLIYDELNQTKPAGSERNQKLMDEAFGRASHELSMENTSKLIDNLDSMSPRYQQFIGLQLPMNFGWSLAESSDQSVGHVFFISICKNNDGTYTAAQANAGGMALGDYTSTNMHMNFQMPLTNNRPPIVEFKKLTKEEVIEFLNTAMSYKEKHFDSYELAQKSYNDLFTSLKDKQTTDRIPSRRAQTTSNCGIRSLKELLIYAFQKYNKIDLANSFFTYSVARNSNPLEYDEVKPLIKDPNEIKKSSISALDNVKTVDANIDNNNDNGSEDGDEEDQYTKAEFANKPGNQSIIGFFGKSQLMGGQSQFMGGQSQFMIENESVSQTENPQGFFENLTNQVIKASYTIGNTAYSIATSPIDICNEIRKYIFPPKWVMDKYKIGIENIFNKLDAFNNTFKCPVKAVSSNIILKNLVQPILDSKNGTDPQSNHTNFLNSLRTVIASQVYQDEFNKCREGKENYDPLVHTILEMCRIRFEEGDFYKFLDNLMNEIGIVGEAKVSAEDFDIIDNVDPEFKISAFEVNLKKFFGHVNMNFDPHLQGNLPFVLGTLLIGDKNVRLLRTGSPTIEGCTGKAQINNEFRGYLQNCVMEGKKHLYISLQNDKTKTAGTGDETGRNSAIKDLQNEFPENFYAVVLAQDSRFYKQVDDRGKALGTQDAQEFLEQFADELLLKKDTGFYFPQAWKDNPKFVKNITTLLRFVLKTIYKNKTELTRQEKQDFIEIFYANLSLYLMSYCNADNCNISCKDAIDRAGKLNALVLELAMIIEDAIDNKKTMRTLKVMTHSPAFWTKSQAIINSHGSDTSNGRRERFISAEKTLHDKRNGPMIQNLNAREIASYLEAATKT